MSTPPTSDSSRHLPLRPAVFSALAALAEGPRPGFAILTSINEALPSRPVLGPGTLYRLLREMRQEGLIEPADPPSADDAADARRQYHALTSLGRAVLGAEAARLRRTLHAAGLLEPDGGGV